MALRGECYVICCDLMNVQCAPKLRASSAYYKLKLTLHNFTVYNLATHDALCYWFNETDSNLSSSVFASCLYDYFSELIQKEKKPIILYSDGCNYQNRNAVLANALLHFSLVNNVTITQKYLEKGHTYMEGDSVHATVERYCEDRDLYLPSQFCQAALLARRFPMPYRSKQVDFTFFKNFGEESTMRYESIRPGKMKPTEPKVVDIRVLQYLPNGKIHFKLNYYDDFKELPARHKPVNLAEVSFQPLFNSKFKIPLDKFSDLQSMKPFMPADCHPFNDNLPHETQSVRLLNRQKRNKKTEPQTSKPENMKTETRNEKQQNKKAKKMEK